MLTSDSGSKHLYFEVNQRPMTEEVVHSNYRTAGIVQDQDTSFGTRDQSVQEGNGLIRRTSRRLNTSKSSGSRVNQARPFRKHTDQTYISPFILLAEKRAQERAQQQLQPADIRRHKKATDWDTNTSATRLFDPTIHKQEIFKLPPRRPAQKGNKTENTNTNNYDQEDQNQASELKQSNSATGKSRMTIRTTGVSRISYLFQILNLLLE